MSFCTWIQQEWLRPYISVFMVLHFVYMVCELVFFIKGIFVWYYLDADYSADYLEEVKLGSSKTSLYSILSILVQIYLVLTCVYVIGCTLLCIMWQRITIFVLVVPIAMFLAVQIYALSLHSRLLGDDMKNEMKSVMSRSYHGDNGEDRMTMSINNLFMRLNCCAVDNYMDLNQTNWQRQHTIDSTDVTVEFKTPYFCCILECTSSQTYCNTKRIPRMPGFTSMSQVECAINPTKNNSNYMKGCYSVLEKNLDSLFICNIICIFIEILTIITSVHFYKKNLRHENDIL